MGASAIRRVAAGLVAATGGLVVAALALEIGLRIAGYRQPVLLEDSLRNVYSVEPNAAFTYYGYMPGAVEDFANPLKLNALGFHDRDYSPERPSPTTYRIMVLGDSYVAAWEVPLEETFHKRLEARLEREDPLGRGSYQVIAFGQGRSAQEQEIQWMRRYASIYRPDVILYLFFCGNYFMENDPVTFSEASSFGVCYTREVAARKIKLFRKLLLFPELRLNGLVAEATADQAAIGPLGRPLQHLPHVLAIGQPVALGVDLLLELMPEAVLDVLGQALDPDIEQADRAPAVGGPRAVARAGAVRSRRGHRLLAPAGRRRSARRAGHQQQHRGQPAPDHASSICAMNCFISPSIMRLRSVT